MTEDVLLGYRKQDGGVVWHADGEGLTTLALGGCNDCAEHAVVMFKGQ